MVDVIRFVFLCVFFSCYKRERGVPRKGERPLPAAVGTGRARPAGRGGLCGARGRGARGAQGELAGLMVGLLASERL